MRPSILLTFDSIVNLALGVLLLTFPAAVIETLGIPTATNSFYPNILGAVLFGIGIALWLGRNGSSTGLGFGGAVSINLCGGGVLGSWLLFGQLAIPARGYVVLWLLVVLLIGLSAVEVVAHFKGRGRKSAA